ncbi:hypothetical protein SAMN05421493_101125 [Pseudobutyrivibrio sp. 49]|uniref:hypothetical protein n=1 Tax=unclassified Pseudobutyrivibrio TaxID=2638619 RepID=UPI000891F343|nr:MULTISPECIES: hypothetical protein [unclassified Pseudobutyrivibrio]SDH28804.1 hypothetical protein SAMN05421493_101125 [Pseudobutyrivibrio sp. 49]SFN52783.1 hypothetical protein SAMN04487831_101557 [Pseudobutyrivibrio sp. UC1225]
MDKKFFVRILALAMVAVLVQAYLNRNFLFSEADELDLNINTIMELSSEKAGDGEESDSKEEQKNDEAGKSEEEPKSEELKSGEGQNSDEDVKPEEAKSDDESKATDETGAEGEKKDGEEKSVKLRKSGEGSSDGEDTDGEEEEEEGEEGEGNQQPTEEEKDKWTVTVRDGIEHISIEISNHNPSVDDTVSVIARPDDGYQVKSLSVKPAVADTFTEISLSPSEDGSCSFTQPNGDAIIDASAEIVSYTIATPTIYPEAAQTECSIQIQGIIKQPESTAEGNTNACVGDKVVLSVIEKVGYVLSSIAVTDSNSNKIDAVKNLDGNYEFMMPAANIDSIVATFIDFKILEEATKPFIVNANGHDIPQVGDRLTASTYALPSIQWKWYANDVFIEGATSEILVLTDRELGKTIKVQATQPRNAAGEGKPATDISLMSEATQPVVGREAGTITAEEVAAAIIYDYVNETINVTADYEVALSDSSMEGQTSLVITDIIDREVNRVVYIRRKATESSPASEWLAVFIPERPAAPVISVENAVTSDWNNGGLVGTNSAMEYRLISATTYTRANDTYTKVPIGTYVIRYAASATAFAGKTAEYTVRRQVIELTAQNKPVIVNVTASRTQPIIGDTLEVQVNAGPGITYQWYAGSTAISGATGVRYTLPTNTYNKYITVRATQAANVDGEGHPASAITVASASVGPVKKVPGDSISESEIKEHLSYNYPMEVVAISSDYEISTGSGSSGTANLKLTSVLDRNSAKYIYGRRKASDWKEASSWVKVSIPERPASPSNLTTEDASSSTAEDGKIIGTSTSMEYKASGASSYTKASASYTTVKAGTYFVRVAATGSNFASKYVTVKVEAKAEKKETTTATKKTTTKKTSNKKSSNTSKKTEVDGEGTALDFDLIDKDDMWKTLPEDTKAALKELLESTSGELIDANDMLDASAVQESEIAVQDVPIALVVGKGVIVIELDKMDYGGVKLPDAYAVAKSILTEEQIDLISRGGLVELKIATNSTLEERIPDAEQAVFEKGFLEYSEVYPDLTKEGYFDINISYKFDSHDWKEVTETLAPIKFVFELPDNLKNSAQDFYMIRVHDGESALLGDQDEDLNTVTISSEQFSTYLLVSTPVVPLAVSEPIEEEVDEKGNSPIKFFVTHQWPILFWALVGLDVVFLASRKIRKMRRMKKLKTAE